MKKLFVIRKYILANSVSDAIKKEHNFEADDCWVDDDWKKNNEKINSIKRVDGFNNKKKR